jgi:predicted outer membrane protein
MIMKQIFFSLVGLCTFLFVAPHVNAQSKFDSWPELKAFHKVMSQTFHPSEEGNLEPIKTRSQEMVDRAQELSKSTIPAEFDKKSVREAVEKLAVDSKKLHEMIQHKATDAEITTALSALHDTFHLIVERCSKEDHHD